MKKGKIIQLIIVVFVSLLFILWLILSGFYPCSIWSVSLKDWVGLLLTFIIGIVIAYILAEKNTKKRLFLDVYVDIVNSLIIKINSCSASIINDYANETFSIQLLSDNKILSNLIELLDQYSDRMKVFKELEVIKIIFGEYKVITTENVEEVKNKEALRTKAILKLSLIEKKLDEIKLKLFLFEGLL